MVEELKMFLNFYNQLSFEAQFLIKIAFMVFTAFFVILSSHILLNLVELHVAQKSFSVNNITGVYFNQFTVLLFSAYGFFFSMRKL